MIADIINIYIEKNRSDNKYFWNLIKFFYHNILEQVNNENLSDNLFRLVSKSMSRDDLVLVGEECSLLASF